MSILLDIGRPQPRQLDFLQSRRKYVAFGGGRGGGKSFSIRMKAKLLALEYEGIKILILRRTYKELQNNHIDILRLELHGIARYNASDKRFTFDNGSTIAFGYCDADSHVLQYQGAEYDVIFIDEATQFKEEWLKVFPASLRGVNDFPKRIYYTCNPGGVSHGYIKRLFIDQDFNESEDPEDYQFIRSLVMDNDALLESQPDYVKQLEALPYKLRRAWLEGDWDILEGAFFEEWTDDREHYADRRHTHVIDPFDIPREWAIYRTFDWGFARPFAVHWWAVDYDGNLYCILELYGMGREPNEGIKWTADRVFKEIARTEREHPWLKGKRVHGIADPSIWAKESTGISIADTASSEGVYFVKADNERIPGWMQVHYRLQFDEEGYPRMQFFSNCKHAIRTMPLMMYDPVKVEDMDTDLEDHCADSIRYMAAHRPVKPVVVEKAEPILFDPLNQHTKISPYRRL